MIAIDKVRWQSRDKVRYRLLSKEFLAVVSINTREIVVLIGAATGKIIGIRKRITTLRRGV